MRTATARASAGREVVIVGLMALGFGLVGIDRFLISTLFPVIARDLKLGYGDIGTITGALALAWGFAALFMGNMSDRIGRRRVLSGALVLFSLLIGGSGLAVGLGSLILVRVVMGFADGAYTPASIAATMAASAPQRHGMNIGIQQMMLPLFGLGFGPLLATWLLGIIDWRLIFPLFALPGLLLSWAVWRSVPDAAKSATPPRGALADWRQVIGFHNIRLGMGMMLCSLTCLITTSALLPNYLIDHLHLSFGQMGPVMSAIGIGAAAGTASLPFLSDRIGRKPVMLLSTVGVGISLLMLARTGPFPQTLFSWLFCVHFFNNALITLTVGPLCAETVPPSLMATASGVVIAVGELFGGGIAPVIGGRVAERFGIDHILFLPVAASVVGFLLCTALRETRPRLAAAHA
jgi:predicted MFS family arabinose efflux permease